MDTIQSKVQQQRARLSQACEQSGRPSGDVLLLAVSKFHPAACVQAAFEAGLRHFGENYVQEGLEKIEALGALRGQLTWHLIGPLQANKTRVVAEQFDWVHTVDRLKIAERLSAQRPPGLAPLQVCIQVNVSGEESKSGVMPADVIALAQAVARLPNLRLRGLMSIPEPTDDLALQRAQHRQLAALLAQLNGQGLALDVLSMGMSADLEAAVAEGSTMVRIGTAIFGSRPVKSQAG